MNLPWQRRSSADDNENSGRRRRQRNLRVRSRDQHEQSRATNLERRRQRIAIGVGAALVLVIIIIVGAGFYKEFVEPPRVMAGSIRGEKFTMGDLVERLRVRQGINRYQGGYVDLSVDPFQFLQDLLFVEIVRQAAPTLGLEATEDVIDKAIEAQFYPKLPPGQESDPAQLKKEFKNTYQGFLTQVRLSDKDYRRMVEEQVLLLQLKALLSSNIPDEPPQVEVEWIRVDFENPVIPEEIRDRLDKEDFESVAGEFFHPMEFGDEKGYVGWIPEGAFPDLDPVLYGSPDPDNEQESLAIGEISQPVYGGDATYIIHLLSSPKEQELTPRMRLKLVSAMMDEWRNGQVTRGSKEKWLKVNFDSHRYAWVADQVAITAPRIDKNEEGEGQGSGLIGSP
jgi:hypothetical protein